MKEYTCFDEKKNINKINIGDNVKINDFVNLYGCTISNDTMIGPFVEIQKNAYIGEKCKVQSHSFICEGVVIEDGVFIGHNVSFINDLFPRAVKDNGQLVKDGEWELKKTLVKKGASIGTGAVIMAGITIGEKSLIGAGSVVLHDVPNNAVVVGNPGKVLRYITDETEEI